MSLLADSVSEIDNRLLPKGFVKQVYPDTLFYTKGICEFKVWKTRTRRFYFIKLIPNRDNVDEDIYLMSSNNHSYYKYNNVTLTEMLDILCSCTDVNKLDMYLENRDNLNALDVLACQW